jgi:hypothetical protein
MIVRRTAPLALLLGVMGPAACAVDEGRGFATLKGGSLAVSLEAGAARDLGQNTLLSDLAYRVHLNTAMLSVETVELSELSAASTNDVERSFDPANPPAGYTLCHGGHCHAEDGTLVSYAEIEAELAGGVASFEPVATMPVRQQLDLLAATFATLDSVEPSPELPRTTLRQVSVRVSHLELTGSASGGPNALDPVAFSVNLPASGAFERGIDISIDEDGPAELRADVSVELDGTLFDGVDFTALELDAAVEDLDHPLAIALTRAVFATEPALRIDD